MAPTMQIACKAFIAPDSAARSPKESYTHVPHSPRRHARPFLRNVPRDAADQIRMGHVFGAVTNATILSPLATAKAFGLGCSRSLVKPSSNPRLRLWVKVRLRKANDPRPFVPQRALIRATVWSASCHERTLSRIGQTLSKRTRWERRRS